MKKLSILATLLLFGCGASSSAIGPGRYAVSCNRGIGGCYEEAQHVCPDGFDVADSETQRGAVVNSFGSAAFVTPTYRGELIVDCRP